MVFDAETAERTVTRDRVMRLRDFLKALPAERFGMWTMGEQDYVLHECSTPACIYGWALAINYDAYQDATKVSDDLGLTRDQGATLFRLPLADSQIDPSADNDPHLWAIRASRDQAVAVLDHYLDTGEIDWSVAK